MVQQLSPELIEQIRNPSTILDLTEALRCLKNEIVGHDQRKEEVVRSSLVPALRETLSCASWLPSGRRQDSVSGQQPHSSGAQWRPADDVRLQAVLVLGGLANGGAAFAPPLLAARIPRELVYLLRRGTHHRLVTAALKALRNLSRAVAVANKARGGTSRDTLSVYEEDGVRALKALCRQRPTTSPGKHQLPLIVEIVSLMAIEEQTRAALVERGILEELGAILASFIYYTSPVDSRAREDFQLPDPPFNSVVPSIIAAIAALLKGSAARVFRFVLARPLLHALNTNFTTKPYWEKMSPVDPLLPSLYVPHNKSVSFSSHSTPFPALGGVEPGPSRSWALSQDTMYSWTHEQAHRVCGWLLFVARSWQGAERLSCLHLLALVNNVLGSEGQPPGTIKGPDIQKQTERAWQLSLLAVPLAVALIARGSADAASEALFAQGEDQLIKEDAPEVLALLVQDRQELQKAAVEAGAIQRLCPLLKKSFDNVTFAKPMWSARSSADEMDADDILPQECRMGPRGLQPELFHAMRCRQTALEALAALARKEDIHRKAIVESGVVSCIIDSLKPFSAEQMAEATGSEGRSIHKDGNIVDVVLAACEAARSLSRSVSLLRTSLIDAGIALPIFRLLTHRDSAVKLAATNVCANIALEFSPMREDLISAGVITTLVKHARENDMLLRIASICALKHLVLHAPKEMKIQCLEGLGTGWLAGAIQGEGHLEMAVFPPAGGVSIGMSTSNAAGEQVDLLNPSSMDVDDPPTAGKDEYEDNEAEDEDEDEDGEMMYDEQSSTHYQASQLRSTLRQQPPTSDARKYIENMERSENDPIILATRYDIEVQEQSLNFVRNLLNGEDNAVMLEHLLDQIGSNKLFGLLNDKLAPLSPSSRSSAHTASANNQIYQPTELILATVHVITHIANASAKHKSLLTAQRSLLTNWLPHFNHPDFQVRLMCVWAVNSLTWIEDDGDRPGARQRVEELRALGFETAVRGLIDDNIMDVKERVKTALRQFEGF